MIRNLLLTLLLLFVFIPLTLYAQQFDWAGNIGGTANEYGRAIATDDSGYVYVTGFFQGTVDFDPGSGITNLTSAGGSDAFILKLTNTGTLVWAKSVGSTGNVSSYAIDVDSFGNVYVAGRFQDTANFDPNGSFDLISAGGYDMFVLKLNGSGNFIWASAMGGTATDQINSLAVDAVGNVYASGVFNGTANFDPGAGTLNITSAGLEDFFMLKLSSSGSLMWAHGIGSTGNDRSYAMAIDNAGNVYATGVFSGTVDFDPATATAPLTSAGNFDVYVLKLDNNGNYVWARNMGGTSHDFGYGITTDILGNVLTTGYFQGTGDYDPGAGTTTLTSEGNYDIFLHKMDASGNFLWARSMGGAADDRGYSVATDAAGDIYLTGYFINTADLDHSSNTQLITSAGMADFYIHKTDAAGNNMWVAPIGGANHDFGLGLAVDAGGNIYTTGNYEGTSDFDPHATATFNLTPVGGSDVFVLKIKQCATASTVNINACETYTSPSGTHVWTTSGIYMDTIPNAANCDSVITINLTIDQNSNSAITPVACHSYTSPSGKYMWNQSGMYTDTIPNAVGCDSIITIALTVNPTYSIQNNVSICSGDSILLQGSYQKIPGIYTDHFTSAAGCDSTVVTDLTINQVDITVNQGMNTLVSNATAATYRWLDCDNNYQVVSGATAQDFTPTVAGNYAVEVITMDGCIDTSACYFVAPVGIDEVIASDLIEIYPNPVVDHVTIEFKDTPQTVEAELLSGDGKLIRNYQISGVRTFSVTMKDLAAGIYFIKLKTEDGIITNKIIKQ